MICYAYNTQITPAAPFVVITLRNPMTGQESQGIPAQLDTAADRTVLPRPLVLALGLSYSGAKLFSGLGGNVVRLPLYAVLLGVHTFPLRLVEVIAHADEPWVLLGRDVLNELRSLLDGPGKGLEIDDPT